MLNQRCSARRSPLSDGRRLVACIFMSDFEHRYVGPADRKPLSSLPLQQVQYKVDLVSSTLAVSVFFHFVHSTVLATSARCHFCIFRWWFERATNRLHTAARRSDHDMPHSHPVKPQGSLIELIVWSRPYSSQLCGAHHRSGWDRAVLGFPDCSPVSFSAKSAARTLLISWEVRWLRVSYQHTALQLLPGTFAPRAFMNINEVPASPCFVSRGRALVHSHLAMEIAVPGLRVGRLHHRGP